MVLMGILIGISVPALSNGSKQVSLACTEISGQLAIARSYAITNSCYTAVIFPQMSEIKKLMPSSTKEKAQALTLANHYNACCRIAVVAKDDQYDDVYHFVMWIPNSNWVQFATGALIADGSTYDFGESVSNVPFGSLKKFATKTTGAVKDNSVVYEINRCVIFSKSGQLETTNSSKSTMIYVRQGAFDLRTEKFTP